ncbi:hypothetical protein AAG570_003040 [Ranatra chinensis]|uniref:Uncharacterized protein n=1 Tax=Ranatra chinensis TaxID=642074 RepID=A0ABD0YNK2_9HEMI
MASKRRNMSYENKKQETTEIDLPTPLTPRGRAWKVQRETPGVDYPGVSPAYGRSTGGSLPRNDRVGSTDDATRIDFFCKPQLSDENADDGRVRAFLFQGLNVSLPDEKIDTRSLVGEKTYAPERVGPPHK